MNYRAVLYLGLVALLAVIALDLALDANKALVAEIEAATQFATAN